MFLFKLILSWAIKLFLAGTLFLLSYFSFTGNSYDYEDLTKNYEAKSKELFELKGYIHSIVPQNKHVDIEFKNENVLEIFRVRIDSQYYQFWDVETQSSTVDTLLRQLGWTVQTLKTIKRKLDAVQCISITTGDPFTIGFQRRDMGKYSYCLFNKPLNDSLKSIYNDSFTHILYKKDVALEWGSGVLGSQSFPDFKKMKLF